MARIIQKGILGIHEILEPNLVAFFVNVLKPCPRIFALPTSDMLPHFWAHRIPMNSAVSFPVHLDHNDAPIS